MKFNCIFYVLILFSCLWMKGEPEDLSFGKNFVREKGIWCPPWDQAKTTPERVMPLGIPFTYDTMERKTYLTYDEAKKASEQVDADRFLGITKFRDGEYDVNYLMHYNLSPIIPENQREIWLDKVHQYALFKAFESNKQGVINIKDGKFYRTESIMNTNRCTESDTDLSALMSRLHKYDVAIISTNISYGKVYYSASRPVHVDLLRAAQNWIDLVNFAYEWSVVEELDGMQLATPSLKRNGVDLYKKVKAGWLGEVEYKQNEGLVDRKIISGVTIGRADEPFDFINDYLGKFLINRHQCEVQGTEYGKVCVSIADGKSYVWMIDDRTYMLVGSHKETFAAYLKRYPSILPVDLKIDREAWMRREVAGSIQRLEAYAAAEPDDKEQSAYQNEYQYLCQFIEQIDNAPFLWGWLKKISKDEERYHFSVVREWWEKNQERYALRKHAPIPVREVTREGHGGHKNTDDEVTKKFRERSQFYWRSRRVGKGE